MEKIKLIAVFILMAVALVFVLFFMNPVEQTVFQVGNPVNYATFKQLLIDADKVYIVMDVRGVNDSIVRQNILQCGVDFAGTVGLSDLKNTSFMSLDEVQGCYLMDKSYPIPYCLNQMKDGITLYVHEGNGPEYFTNAMMVGIGRNYTADGCKISIK